MGWKTPCSAKQARLKLLRAREKLEGGDRDLEILVSMEGGSSVRAVNREHWRAPIQDMSQTRTRLRITPGLRIGDPKKIDKVLTSKCESSGLSKQWSVVHEGPMPCHTTSAVESKGIAFQTKCVHTISRLSHSSIICNDGGLPPLRAESRTRVSTSRVSTARPTRSQDLGDWPLVHQSRKSRQRVPEGLSWPKDDENEIVSFCRVRGGMGVQSFESAAFNIKSSTPKVEKDGATRLFSCGLREVAESVNTDWEGLSPDFATKPYKTWLEACAPCNYDDPGDFVVSIASSERATLALTAGGRVLGWGDGALFSSNTCNLRASKSRSGFFNTSRKQSNHAASANAISAAVIRDVLSPLQNARMVSCGPKHAAVVVANGGIFTWGVGAFGRLGHGTGQSHTRPKRVERFPLNSAFLMVACGGAHTACIVATSFSEPTGTLYMWGDARAGQLGYDFDKEHLEQPKYNMINKSTVPSKSTATCARLPVEVSFFKQRDASLRHVCCGLHHTLAVAWEPIERRNVDRSTLLTARLYAWGFGDSGRLGTGVSGACKCPARVLLPVEYDYKRENIESAPAAHVTSAAAGEQHSMALLSDGRVFAWGHNVFGQLGLGRASKQPVPMPERVKLPRKRISAIACGSRHSGCVTSDGAVLLWGFGDEGQLGAGPDVAMLESTMRDETSTPVARPLVKAVSRESYRWQPEEEGKWAADSISLGVRHTVVLCRNVKAGISKGALADASFGRVEEPNTLIAPTNEPKMKTRILLSDEVPPSEVKTPEAKPEPEMAKPPLDKELMRVRLLEYKARKAAEQEMITVTHTERDAANARYKTLLAKICNPQLIRPAPRGPSTPDKLKSGPKTKTEECLGPQHSPPKKVTFSEIFYDNSRQDASTCWIGNSARRAKNRGSREARTRPSTTAPLRNTFGCVESNHRPKSTGMQHQKRNFLLKLTYKDDKPASRFESYTNEDGAVMSFMAKAPGSGAWTTPNAKLVKNI